MTSAERSLRRAYELGRLRSSMRIAPLPLVFALFALATGAELWTTLALAALLIGVVVALRFRGLVYGRSAMPGLWAGAAAGAIPVLARTSGHCCMDEICWDVCLFACVGGGLMAGAAIAYLAGREANGRWPFLISAGGVACLTASLGCVMSGTAGVIGMAVALVVSSLAALSTDGLRTSS